MPTIWPFKVIGQSSEAVQKQFVLIAQSWQSSCFPGSSMAKLSPVARTCLVTQAVFEVKPIFPLILPVAPTTTRLLSNISTSNFSAEAIVSAIS